MRRTILTAALIAFTGCDEPRTHQPKPAAAASWIGKAVIVKPGKESHKPGLIMAVTPDMKNNWFAPLDLEAFRAVVLDELPEVYFEGKLDDHARWLVKVEDGPASGKTVAVYKHRVDLIPIR